MRHRPGRLVLFLLVLLLAAPCAAREPDKAVTLITQKEAAMKDAPSGLQEIGRPLNDGPAIKVIAPETDGTYRSPLKIIVQFLPRSEHRVDLSKLKVECLKFFTINLTDRVMPYASTWGIRMAKASIPSGHYRIRITIGDDKGGVTQDVFTFNVK
ncbi:MAG: hypothetical protein M0Z75_13850 [Nitrospiraceae bacterium]|nr:hypothetical protein [Nitrospiraceae bacterium]